MHDNAAKHTTTPYKVRVVFDGEDIKLPFCKDTYCSFDEFIGYFRGHLVYDADHIEGYCGGNMGEQYKQELKYRA